MATCDSDPKHGLDVDPRHGVATGIFCSPFSAWDAAGGSIESWLPGTPQTTGWDGPGKGISGSFFQDGPGQPGKNPPQTSVAPNKHQPGHDHPPNLPKQHQRIHLGFQSLGCGMSRVPTPDRALVGETP